MNLINQHIFLFGIGAAIAGTAFIFLVGNVCARFISRREIRTIIKSKRTIRWNEVAHRCTTEPGVIVVERGSSPRRVWFLTDNIKSPMFSKRGSLRIRGLLVLDPPDAGQILGEVQKIGGRFAEIDPNSTLW